MAACRGPWLARYEPLGAGPEVTGAEEEEEGEERRKESSRAMIVGGETQPSSYGSGSGYAIALVFVVLSQTLLHQLHHQNNILTAVKIKTAVVGLIYKKALTLANSSREHYTTGQIVDLMSADARQRPELAISMNLLWSAPFQIIMAVVFLWKELGPSVLGGAALLLLVIPINALITAKVRRLEGFDIGGGQEQRVSLARTVYSNAVLYLLDDPLSVVDVHVGKHNFENLTGPSDLLKSKMKTSVVLKYLQAFDWHQMWLTVAAYTGQSALAIGQNRWLSSWTAETAQVSDSTGWKQSENYKLGVHGLLGFIQGSSVVQILTLEPWKLSKRPPVGWPDKGITELVNNKVHYRKDLGLALNGVSFQTQSKEKVGIVGRTRAGKSTLTNRLFRVLERYECKMIIDGIDLSTIGPTWKS
ncbi:hypothetical protein DUI87_11212 [Hirundo rustica rustica]|uniref:ABC transmembrane type-1 domain-containing protein n=1 Tax=Hirundo rustica rustica TaxID=333673 RepID=A0A3M0KY88_HIRRU|nr:hypothetical protein DUI87_11212 [Hirundo rustica rustica]